MATASESARLLVSALLSASALSLLVEQPAWAQEPPQTAEAASVGGLEDIVVTARRRAESVQDIPVAVQAISAEQVQRRDLSSLERIAAATPQFTVARASNGAGAQLTLRGIGSSATSIGIEQSVAVVVDGVYYGQGRIINEGFFDLARVEILKGPQALFFGKNATAGVISLTTADPGPEPEYIGRISYEIGARQPSLEAIVSQPLTDTLGVRVALRGSKMYGGYYQNRSNDAIYTTLDAANFVTTNHVAPAAAEDQPQEKELVGRVTLKFDPSEALQMTLKGSASLNETIGNGWNYAPVNCPSGATTLNSAYPCRADFLIYQNDMPDALASSLPFARDDGQLFNKYRAWQVTGTINYDVGDLTLTSITNYNWNNNRFGCDCDFLGGGVWATEDASYRAFSEEVRVQTGFDGPFNFMVGGLYSNTKRDFFQAVVFAGSEDSAAAPENRFISYSKDSQTKGTTWSGYGQVTWTATEQLEATAGVRYTYETKSSFFTQPYVNRFLTGLFRPESAPVDGTLFADQTFNDWSPEFTVSWKPTPGVLLYGAYKTAYKSGGFSNSAINSALVTVNPAGDFTFDPERGKGFEAGLKTTLFDNQLRFNVTAYNFEYTDLQIDFFNAQVFAYVTYNAGAARSKGLETEIEYAPNSAPGLVMRGSLNYNKSRYEDFLAPCFSGQSPAEGCTLVVDGVPFQDLSGVETAVAPDWTATIGASYDTELSPTLKIGGSFDGRYSGSYIGSGFGDFRTTQKAYMVVDAGIRVGGTNDRWELALIGKNLTDEFYFTGGGTAPLTGANTGLPTAVPGDILGYGGFPRTVKMQLTLRY